MGLANPGVVQTPEFLQPNVRRQNPVDAQHQAESFTRLLDYSIVSLSPRQMSGGADRDRTGGLLVANQALSQLSYGPSPMNWWVWEDLHPRPHPYQGCALAT